MKIFLPLAATLAQSAVLVLPAAAQDSSSSDRERIIISDAAADAADAAAAALETAEVWGEECEELEDKVACYAEEDIPLAYMSSTGIRPADYPVDAWQSEIEGKVEFAVDFDASGSFTDCRVTQSSGNASLDAATCSIVLQRGELAWVSDVRSSGTANEYYTWKMRKPEFEIFSLSVAFTLGADGKMSDCEIVRAEGKVPEGMMRDFEDDACPNSGYQPPYRDKNGVPVERRVQLNLSVDELPLQAK